jgi:hypothetical protein
MKINEKDIVLFQLERPAIFMFDSLRNFQALEDKLDVRFNSNVYIEYLIYIPGLTSQAIDRNIPKDLFQMRSFLIEENNEIYLKTLVLFTQQKCNTQQLIEINKFSKKSLKWTKMSFFESKISNFHGCQIVFGLSTHTMPHSDFASSDGISSPQAEGYLIILIEVFARHLNYTFDINFKNIFSGKFHKPSLKVTARLNVLPIDENSYHTFSMSAPLMSSFNGFLIPPGEAYTPFETLFLPFDTDTWMWFSVLYFITFSVTFIVNCLSRSSFRNLVFGKNVSSPAYNIFVAFMGGGQKVLPQKSFARFLLMSFILFSLVMR